MRLETVIGGNITGAGEWACTANFMLNSNIGSPAQLAAIMTAVRSALSADSIFRQGYASDTNINSVKGLYYQTNVQPATYAAEAGGGAIVGSGTAVHAPQVCVVASLRSDLPGRSYRGRMYVPYRSGGVSSAGVVSTTGQGLVSGFADRYQTAVVNALADQGIGAQWSVWSKVHAVATAITSILVGTQCDTQRDRNPNRDETYSIFTPTGVELPDADPDTLSARQRAILENPSSVLEGINVPSWVPTALTIAATRIPAPPAPAAEAGDSEIAS